MQKKVAKFWLETRDKNVASEADVRSTKNRVQTAKPRGMDFQRRGTNAGKEEKKVFDTRKGSKCQQNVKRTNEKAGNLLENEIEVPGISGTKKKYNNGCRLFMSAATQTMVAHTSGSTSELERTVDCLNSQVLRLEKELKQREEALQTLSMTNQYMQQQMMGQAAVISQIMAGRKVFEGMYFGQGMQQTLPGSFVSCNGANPTDYAGLRPTFTLPENGLYERDAAIDQLRTEHKKSPKKPVFAPESTGGDEGTSKSVSSPEAKDVQARYEHYKQRQRESVLGDLLKWSVPEPLKERNQRAMSGSRLKDADITAKITDKSPSRGLQMSKEYSNNKSYEENRQLKLLRHTLQREIAEKTGLQEELCALKQVSTVSAKKRRKQLECDIEVKNETIRNVKDRLIAIEMGDT